MSSKIKVVFVCLGNICRSPTAEGVFRHHAEEEGVHGQLLIDSAGTGAWHVGESPDRRSAAAARQRGVILEGAARKASKKDFERFDYVLAMDADNYDNLARMAPSAAARKKLHMFRDFDEASPEGSEVPDPYYGGDGGFEKVFDICQAASEGLLAFLRETHDF
jgi:protein-tyrosine phosphatase